MLKKLANIISNLLIAVLILLVAAVLISKLIFHVEMKAVLTGSMEPELPVGSLLIISPTDYEDIAIGDDITYVRDGSLTLVTHRVIEKDDQTRHITTQGIANNSPDPPTMYDNIVGRVVYHIPTIGYFVIWTATLQGKIICVIMIAALVAISLLFSGEDDEKKAERAEAQESQQTE